MTIVERTLMSEGRRYLVIFVASALISEPIRYTLIDPFVSNRVTALSIHLLVVINAWSLTHIVVTLIAFGRAPARTLTNWLGTTDGPRRGLSRFFRHDGALPIVFSCAALAAAAVLPRLGQVTPVESERLVLTIMAVLTVVLCWLMLAVTFAEHYARLTARHGGLDFPGEQQPVFSDYLYFAVGVATTFGATDVTVVDQKLRRVVTSHAILAFVFNTVILALSLSALG